MIGLILIFKKIFHESKTKNKKNEGKASLTIKKLDNVDNVDNYKLVVNCLRKNPFTNFKTLCVMYMCVK